MSHGKKYRQVKALVDSKKTYSISEWLDLLSKLSYTKFVPSVEIAIKTFAEPKYNDQQLRTTVSLPNWTWKKVRVAVFVTEDKVAIAKKAGADVAWFADLIAKIEKWEIDFDVLITEPTSIKDLAKVAKVLWPKWLMPSPKAGTVTNDIEHTIWEIKKWRIEVKIDKTWNIHWLLGKLNFGTDKLAQNVKAFIQTINDNKPSGVKWKLIKKIAISCTMSPSVQISENL